MSLTGDLDSESPVQQTGLFYTYILNLLFGAAKTAITCISLTTIATIMIMSSLSFRYFFRSGNIEHPGDKLFNTSVEVLPFDVSLKI